MLLPVLLQAQEKLLPFYCQYYKDIIMLQLLAIFVHWLLHQLVNWLYKYMNNLES